MIMMTVGGILLVIGAVGMISSGSSDADPDISTTSVAASAETGAESTSTSASSTTTSTTTTATTTTTPTTTTTTTIPVTETVQDFVLMFAAAIDGGDSEFLFARLHPAVTGGFGLEVCRSWIEAEILQLRGYQLTGPVEGPVDQTFTTPAGEGVIADAYSAPVSFDFQGQTFDSEGGFALVEGEMRWLGQCR